ncbi:hypothetical protein [[Mycoplasma] testudinis]|uniref:hypothetical protein n=1 Tax=[Mycoplasma] testudinis TaxID=33924 RepID=UPI00048967F1|nr:hypothetical protein [[Mycoplasma] testudinis]
MIILSRETIEDLVNIKNVLKGAELIGEPLDDNELETLYRSKDKTKWLNAHDCDIELKRHEKILKEAEKIKDLFKSMAETIGDRIREISMLKIELDRKRVEGSK